MAAARAKALSPPALLERLDQRLPLLAGGSRSAPERQRTLRATIAWSHDLLTPAEQTLFARLAVFAGGCTLEAAEQISGADVDTIASLVDKSLLRRTDDRYWMLETIREFAAGRLDELSDADALRDRHAAWYAELGEQARPELRARQGREWLDRLGAEHANLRAALDRLFAGARGGRAAPVRSDLVVLADTWTLDRGPALPGRGSGARPRRRAGAPHRLHSGVARSSRSGRATSATASQGRAVARDRDCRRAARGVYSAPHPWLTATMHGDHRRARALLEEGVELARAGDDEWLLSVATNNLGNLHLVEGDYERATALFEESLAIGEARGDLDRRARALVNLGLAALGPGEEARALELFRLGLAAAVEIGLIEAELNAILGIALCDAGSGEAITAARLLGYQQAAGSRLGMPADDVALEERTLAALRDALGANRLEEALAAGAALSHDDAIRLALERG